MIILDALFADEKGIETSVFVIDAKKKKGIQTIPNLCDSIPPYTFLRW